MARNTARNRGLDPTRTLCPQCAGDIDATPLGVARHRVKHLEWMRTDNTGKRSPRNEFDSISQLRDAYRQYAAELESLCSDLRSDIGQLTEDVNIRDERIDGLEDDYGYVLDELRRLRTELEQAS